MKLARSMLTFRKISVWGTVLAGILINTSLNLASAEKEETDDQQGLKSGGQGDSDHHLTPNSHDETDPWKLAPCFAPCFNLNDPSGYSHLGEVETLGPEEEKRNFNPWGGKRSLSDRQTDYFNQKRNFNPWGGKKRSPTPISEYFRRIYELNGFDPWAGKRNLISSSSRRSAKDEYPLPFNPWGGR